MDGNVSKKNTTPAIQRNVVSKVPVPKGQVLVVEWHGERSHNGWGFKVYSAGELVNKKDLKMGKIVHEGQSLAVSACRYGERGISAIPKRVFNRGGKAVVEDDREPGRKFAQEQRAWLRQKGFNDREIDTLMRVARPGQVREAVEWAIFAKQRWQQVDPELRERQVEITLAQAVKLSMGPYGWGRTVGALEDLTGVYAPEAANAREFFGIVRGAQAVLEMGLPVATA